MLNLAITFLVIAIIAAIFGFGGIEDGLDESLNNLKNVERFDNMNIDANQLPVDEANSKILSPCKIASRMVKNDIDDGY